MSVSRWCCVRRLSGLLCPSPGLLCPSLWAAVSVSGAAVSVSRWCCVPADSWAAGGGRSGSPPSPHRRPGCARCGSETLAPDLELTRHPQRWPTPHARACKARALTRIRAPNSGWRAVTSDLTRRTVLSEHNGCPGSYLLCCSCYHIDVIVT